VADGLWPKSVSHPPGTVRPARARRRTGRGETVIDDPRP